MTAVLPINYDPHYPRLTKLSYHLIGKHIKEWELADYLGVSKAYITLMVLGHRHIPTNHLISLSTLLKVNPTDLVGWVTPGVDCHCMDGVNEYTGGE